MSLLNAWNRQRSIVWMILLQVNFCICFPRRSVVAGVRASAPRGGETRASTSLTHAIVKIVDTNGSFFSLSHDSLYSASFFMLSKLSWFFFSCVFFSCQSFFIRAALSFRPTICLIVEENDNSLESIGLSCLSCCAL